MDEEKIQQQPKAKDNFRRWDDPLFNDLRKLFSRAKRRAEIEARDAAKEELRAQKKEQRKAEARVRDAKRRKSQAEAKIRKAENARRAAIKAAKEARSMSAKKRRFLEDKKK